MYDIELPIAMLEQCAKRWQRKLKHPEKQYFSIYELELEIKGAPGLCLVSMSL